MKFNFLFPKRLKEARNKKNLKQVKLCTLIGKSFKTISSYENGRRSPNLKVLVQIAEILDVHPGWLLGDILKKGK